MEEKSRQLIIFGNFREISKIDIANKLSDLIDELDFSINMAPDMPIMGQNMPLMRPVLQDKSGQVSVHFGLDRIFYEEDLSATDSYDKFIEKSTHIIEQIINGLELSVRRLACCGSLIHFSPETNGLIYSKIFKSDNFLYNNDSIEWDFMINSRTEEESLKITLNRVVKVISGINVVGMDGTSAGQLVIAYDYNTEPVGTRVFSNEDINTFVGLAKDFREKLLELQHE